MTSRASMHLTSALQHLDRARASCAVAVAELAGGPHTQHATDALNDILEAARATRTLQETLDLPAAPPTGAETVTGPGSPPSFPGPDTTEGAVRSNAASSATPTETACYRCDKTPGDDEVCSFYHDDEGTVHLLCEGCS